jgi:hypothetical protein
MSANCGGSGLQRLTNGLSDSLSDKTFSHDFRMTKWHVLGYALSQPFVP